MKTLLLINKLDNGKLDCSGAQCPPIEDYDFIMGQVIHGLKEAPWCVREWIRLFGMAVQMMDLGIGFLYDVPEYDPFLEEDFGPDPNNDSDNHTAELQHESFLSHESSLKMAPASQYNRQLDPEWQRKRLAIKDELKTWRQEKALQKDVPVWQVIKNTVLEDIARAMPVSREDLMNVRGIGELTFARYGEDILSIVQKLMLSPVNASINSESDNEGTESEGTDR